MVIDSGDRWGLVMVKSYSKSNRVDLMQVRQALTVIVEGSVNASGVVIGAGEDIDAGGFQRRGRRLRGGGAVSGLPMCEGASQ